MSINLHPTSARAAWLAAVEVHAAAVARTFDDLRDAFDPETYEDGGSPEEIAGDVTNVVGKVLAGDRYPGTSVRYAASDAADAAESAACDDYMVASARTPENVARAAVEEFWQSIGDAFPEYGGNLAPEIVAAFDAAAIMAAASWMEENVTGGQA